MRHDLSLCRAACQNTSRHSLTASRSLPHTKYLCVTASHITVFTISFNMHSRKIMYIGLALLCYLCFFDELITSVDHHRPLCNMALLLVVSRKSSGGENPNTVYGNRNITLLNELNFLNNLNKYCANQPIEKQYY